MAGRKYTDEERKHIIKCYTAANDHDERKQMVKNLAEHYNTSEVSIRSVLIPAGVYVKVPYRTKSGKLPCKKEELINRLEEYLGLVPTDLETLSKANKSVIIKLINEYIKDRGDPKGYFKDVL